MLDLLFQSESHALKKKKVTPEFLCLDQQFSWVLLLQNWFDLPGSVCNTLSTTNVEGGNVNIIIKSQVQSDSPLFMTHVILCSKRTRGRSVVLLNVLGCRLTY